MNDVALFPPIKERLETIDKLEKELIDLIIKHDTLLRQNKPAIEAEYMLLVGGLELREYSLSTKLRYLKRYLEMAQSYINRKEDIDKSKIFGDLLQQLQDYFYQLNELETRAKNAIDFSNYELMGDEDVKELKEKYRYIVKKLHPDINQKYNYDAHMLFQNAVEAYRKGNLPQIRLIYNVVNGMNIEIKQYLDEVALDLRIEELEANIKQKQEDINTLKAGFPFNQMEFMMDKDRVAERQAELEESISKLEKYVDVYKDELIARGLNDIWEKLLNMTKAQVSLNL